MGKATFIYLVEILADYSARDEKQKKYIRENAPDSMKEALKAADKLGSGYFKTHPLR